MDLAKQLSRFCLCLLITGGMAAHGQFVGYTSQQTSPQVVFVALTTNSTSPVFTNIGQSAHYLSYCLNASFAGQIDLEGSIDGSHFTILAIASWGTGAIDHAQCHVLQAGGYYAQLRSLATVSSGQIVGAWYSGVASPISALPAGIASIGPVAPPVCDRSIVVSAPNGATTPVAQVINTGDTLYVCGFTISFIAAPAGVGNFNLAWGSANCGVITNGWIMNTNTGTPITTVVNVPQSAPNSGWGGTGQNICVINGAGQGAFFSVSYASFHLS